MKELKIGIFFLALALILSGCSSPGGSSIPDLGGGMNGGKIGGPSGQGGLGGSNPDDPGFDDGNENPDLPDDFLDDLIARGSALSDPVIFNSKAITGYETIIDYDTGYYGVWKTGSWVKGSIVKNVGTGSAVFDGPPPLPGGFQGKDIQTCDLKDGSGNVIGTLVVEFDKDLAGGYKQFKVSVNLIESYNKAVEIIVTVGNDPPVTISGDSGVFKIHAGEKNVDFDLRIEMWDGSYVFDPTGSDDLFAGDDGEYYWVEAGGECCWTNPTLIQFIKIGSKIFILTGNESDAFYKNPAGTDQKYSGTHQEPVYTIYDYRVYELIVEGEKIGLVRVTVEAGNQIIVEYNLDTDFAGITANYRCNGNLVSGGNVMLYYSAGIDITIRTKFFFTSP